MANKKDAYYFSHDSNARNDDKILELRSLYGYEGYGLFWAIIEVLRDSTNYKFELKKIKLLQISLSYPVKKLQNFIESCIKLKLFSKDSEYFWSERLLKSMSEYNEYKQKLSKAGTLGNEIKKQKATGGVSGGDSEANALKESKVKEIKESKENGIDDEDFLNFYLSFDSKSDIDKTFFKWQSTNIMDKGFIKNHYPKFHIVTEEKFRGTALGYLEKRKWKTEINGKMYISNNGTEYEVKPDFSVFVDNQTIILNEEQRKKCYYK